MKEQLESQVLDQKFDIAIIGAGPIGLLLANLLGNQGIRTIIIEKESNLPKQSMAIGITPPSLSILNSLNLDKKFIDYGVKIRNAHIFGNHRKIGLLTFCNLSSPYKFILSVPQRQTMSILDNHLQNYDCVSVKKNVKLLDIEQSNADLHVEVLNQGTGKTERLITRYLVGCDGWKSTVRSVLNIKISQQQYPASFLMADFVDNTQMVNDAYLFFTSGGAVESFPLPDKKRRWIIQTSHYNFNPESNFLERTIAERTGFEITGYEKRDESPFQVYKMVADNYYQGNCVLCGDAGHIMSPIGGQGMNTGFADAEFLAIIFKQILLNNESPSVLFNHYENYRKIAFSIAADRAAKGMWLGTRIGRYPSLLRNIALAILLKKTFCQRHGKPIFDAHNTSWQI